MSKKLSNLNRSDTPGDMELSELKNSESNADEAPVAQSFSAQTSVDMNLFLRKGSETRTQVEHATSWSRAFQTLLTDLKWLNAFAKLNRIACEKTLKRMAKTYLVISDNVIEKFMLEKTKAQTGKQFF